MADQIWTTVTIRTRSHPPPNRTRPNPSSALPRAPPTGPRADREHPRRSPRLTQRRILSVVNIKVGYKIRNEVTGDLETTLVTVREHYPLNRLTAASQTVTQRLAGIPLATDGPDPLSRDLIISSGDAHENALNTLLDWFSHLRLPSSAHDPRTPKFYIGNTSMTELCRLHGTITYLQLQGVIANQIHIDRAISQHFQYEHFSPTDLTDFWEWCGEGNLGWMRRIMGFVVGYIGDVDGDGVVDRDSVSKGEETMREGFEGEMRGFPGLAAIYDERMSWVTRENARKAAVEEARKAWVQEQHDADVGRRAAEFARENGQGVNTIADREAADLLRRSRSSSG